MNPQVFGTEHLIYIAASLLTAFAVCFLTKKYARTGKAGDAVVKVSAGILFLIIFANRLALVFEYGDPNWQKLLTDSFCSTSSYVLSLAILFGKKNNNVLHFIWLIALAGGTITTFYPNFIGQHPSFLYPPTILGMMHHTWSAIVVVLMFMEGYLKLTYKKWYCTFFGFTTFLTVGAFLMHTFDMSDAFHIAEPLLSDTPLTAWVMAPMYALAYGLILLGVELYKKHKKVKQTV